MIQIKVKNKEKFKYKFCILLYTMVISETHNMVGLRITEEEKDMMEWLIKNKRGNYNSYQGVLRQALFEYFTQEKNLFEQEKWEYIPTVICPHCKQQVGDGKFCRLCGKKLPKHEQSKKIK